MVATGRVTPFGFLLIGWFVVLLHLGALVAADGGHPPFDPMNEFPFSNDESTQELDGLIELEGPLVIKKHSVMKVQPGSIIHSAPGMSSAMGVEPSIIVNGHLAIMGTQEEPVGIKVPIILAAPTSHLTVQETLFEADRPYQIDCPQESLSETQKDPTPFVCIRSGFAHITSSIIQNHSTGVYLGPHANATIEETTFEENERGLHIQTKRDNPPPRDIILRNNQFRDHQPAPVTPRVDEPAGILISDSSSKKQIPQPWQGTLVFDNNTFQRNDVALRLDTTTRTDHAGHKFLDNGVAIRTTAPSTTLTGPTFEDNTEDVRAEGEAHVLIRDGNPNRVSAQGRSSIETNDEILGPRPFLVHLSEIFAILVASATILAHWGASKGLFPNPLYWRLSREEVLEDNTRQEILAYLTDHPGTHAREIGRMVGNWSTARHHLKMLERHDFIISEREGNHRRFYPPGQQQRPPCELSTREAILTIVQDNPGTNQSTIADALDISRQLVSYHVQKLEDSGLVVIDRDACGHQLYAGQTTSPTVDR